MSFSFKTINYSKSNEQLSSQTITLKNMLVKLEEGNYAMLDDFWK